MLTSDCYLASEVQKRIQLASADRYGRLSYRVFLNHNLAVATRIAVYKAICVSILLYGCESSVSYRRHIRAKPSICAARRAFLEFAGGTALLTWKFVAELALSRLNSCFFSNNSVGLNSNSHVTEPPSTTYSLRTATPWTTYGGSS